MDEEVEVDKEDEEEEEVDKKEEKEDEEEALPTLSWSLQLGSISGLKFI